jgi:hypothetical protein
MIVAVMQVRIVRMPMHHRRVPMPMGMRLARGIAGRVPMAVMRVVHMPVRVLHLLMRVLVFVHFRQMQVDAQAHQRRGHQQA